MTHIKRQILIFYQLRSADIFYYIHNVIQRRHIFFSLETAEYNVITFTTDIIECYYL